LTSAFRSQQTLSPIMADLFNLQIFINKDEKNKLYAQVAHY